MPIGSLVTNLLIDALEINKSVGDVLGIADVIWRNLELAASALENAVDEVAQSSGIVSLVFVEPLVRDCLRRLSRAKDVHYNAC